MTIETALCIVLYLNCWVYRIDQLTIFHNELGILKFKNTDLTSFSLSKKKKIEM